MPRTARFVGCSEGVRQQLLARGCPVERTVAIPNGIRLEPFASAFEHPHAARIQGIVMSARFARQKDHRTLIEAIALLRRLLEPSYRPARREGFRKIRSTARKCARLKFAVPDPCAPSRTMAPATTAVTLPKPAPTTPELAQAALRAQTSTHVQKLDSAAQAALFARLEQDKKAGRERAAAAFTTAAEDVLRAANTGADARAAARSFLLYGMHYNLWDVDAMDKRP